jgi:hypothetical protein
VSREIISTKLLDIPRFMTNGTSGIGLGLDS